MLQHMKPPEVSLSTLVKELQEIDLVTRFFQTDFYEDMDVFHFLDALHRMNKQIVEVASHLEPWMARVFKEEMAHRERITTGNGWMCEDCGHSLARTDVRCRGCGDVIEW